MHELDQALHERFGFAQFRAGQREVIEHLLARQHTLAVLPTGRGKSLCYQLTAQLLPGTTLVISPLIALMQDQVESLETRGFTDVTCLTSALSATELGRRYAEIERGRYKLVYIAPERCDSPRFQQFVRQTPIDLVVIDEAHCISQWGHDFRPHYRTLLTRLPELKRATFLALTATATPDVQEDIVAALGLPEVERVVADFDRPNLRFEVARTDKREEKEARLLELLMRGRESAIVYASTRKEALAAFELLQSKGLSAGLYHAGLDQDERSRTQRDFQRGLHRIIVATVAFGMGIDKPDVRRVIHFNIPGSLENYYQEAGRAGRDGEPAVCTLLYSHQDVRIQRFLLENSYPDGQVLLRLHAMLRESHPHPVAVGDLAATSRLPEITINAALQILHEQQVVSLTGEGKYALTRPEATRLQVDGRPLLQRRNRASERLHQMIEYAAGGRCRRAHILNYFGQSFAPPCGNCDVCLGAHEAAIARPPAATEESDRIARAILQAAIGFSGRLGRSVIADTLAGSKRKRIFELGLERAKCYGELERYRQDQVLSWIDELVARRQLRVTVEEYPRLCITEAGQQALAEEKLIPLSGLAARVAPPKPVQPESPTGRPAASPESVESFKGRLRQWRFDKAAALNVPAYVILHNTALDEIAERQPRTRAELGAIKGVGSSKLEKYGDEILALSAELPPPGERLTPAAPAVVKVEEPDHSAEPDWFDLPLEEPDEAPAAVPIEELRLQIEVWRQGGAVPSSDALLDALGSLPETNREDLVAVISAVRDLRLEAAADSLLDLLRETSDGPLTAAICSAIGPLEVRQSEPELLPLLDDARAPVRRAAARALGYLRAQSALAKLRELAHHDEAEGVQLTARAALELIARK